LLSSLFGRLTETYFGKAPLLTTDNCFLRKKMACTLFCAQEG